MEQEEGRYIYGIIDSGQKQEFGSIGIGGRGDVVYTLPYQRIAAVISRSPLMKYQVTREYTVAHAKALEAAVETHTVLPVRFCTIAANEDLIIEKVLKPRYQEFRGLLKEMQDKKELGLRARWNDVNAIFAEIAEENREIKQLKQSLLKEKNEQKNHAGRIQIGELVQDALGAKKRKEANELIQELKPLCFEYKELLIYGDMNIMNVAFLIAKEKEHEFDQKVNKLESIHRERKQLKYTNSIIPYNFVEIVIHW
jgi:hypothetical protein